ncbi:hypothetical protein T03_13857 [Trichinella britovi]|uniref:Uncharacterized protein n=2 Tax=Trichinella TaxID=6333 RepID=A0A0V1D061_TRIBR|nr:hypothetical protein T05_10853 [Trichinella murrelli]KRY54821.1 hypothetical protein T03_13857 [Trichinella britovi]KRZ91219.1 hypothetical protein T08_10753 [Trichinella sp. T8]
MEKRNLLIQPDQPTIPLRREKEGEEGRKERCSAMVDEYVGLVTHCSVDQVSNTNMINIASGQQIIIITFCFNYHRTIGEKQLELFTPISQK